MLPRSYNSSRCIIRDLIVADKKYPGAPVMVLNTAKFSVSTIEKLTTKVKKRSGEYRKIVGK